jgi:hypothetical protein
MEKVPSIEGMIKRERVKKLLTNRLKILKDRVISKSYPPTQNTRRLLIRVFAKRGIPRKVRAGGFRFSGLRLKKRLELKP